MSKFTQLRLLRSKGCLWFAAMLCAFGVNISSAETLLPRLIFTGNGSQSKVMSLDEFNRIDFGDNSMFVSSTKNPSNVVELPYSDFNKFSVGEEISSNVGQIATNMASLIYDASASSLRLAASNESVFQLQVFNAMGTKVLDEEVKGGDSVSLLSLTSGVYVAVATDDEGTQKIKFLK